ncbi:MAG: bifunctional 3,4-dihydroxy-2-butanone-4-phosphate synthase/GTP cyclohydrolase II, partial [Candidatus Eremiobacterota bacterium]
RALGFPDDSRDYAVAAAILAELGVSRVELITNNPRKIEGLERHGIRVASRVPLLVPPTDTNRDYLRVKRDKLGHLLG